MNIAWLLLGPGNLHRSRWYLAILGGLLCATGISIVIDASDTITHLTLEGFGWVLVVLGLFKLAFSVVSSGTGMPSMYGFQGLVFMVLGIAIADFPAESGNAIPWLFGLAFLLNGGYQLCSALIIRYPLWGWFVASGIAHLLFGGLMFFQWKQAVFWVIPLFLGAGFCVFGLSTLRTALRLGRYLNGQEGWNPAKAVRYYMDFHMPRRFRQHYFPQEPQVPPEAGSPHGELLVHIWTPTTVAKTEQRPDLVNRYVVARDQEGKFTVGHAALEMAPDVYISHCDGDPNAFDTSDEVWRELRSKDVQGVFLPTFEEEVEHYLQPSVTVRYRNFRDEQLRTFWALYRLTTVYNLTNRNCSVAVALALEAGLMGSLSNGNRLRSLLGLLLNRHLWVAHFIRWKAREMVWTPGLMLDYALALQRVVEG